MNYLIRNAQANDAELIFSLVKELADYEQLSSSVVGAVEDITKTLFSPSPKAEVLIIEENGNAAGFALYFHNYSTFLCRYGIYIEDIFIREAYRGKGYGKALFKKICEEALKHNCGRVEWWCLDWNKPSIDFYLKLGAEAMTDWTVYRLNQEQIKAIAEN
ncbi:MAG: GNAT family N-acetyltransferase [Alphaproteobacteria bacterium]